MNKSCHVLVTLSIVGLLWVGAVSAAFAAPRLTLSPASGTYATGDQFKVDIGVETDGAKSAGVDIWATFDATKLQVVSITKIANPSYGFSEISPNINNSSGKFDMSFVSNSMSNYDATALTGNLAEVTFKAIATGTASMNFVCSKAFTDSNIISSDSTNTDLIDCASNQSGSYTINPGIGGDTSATPTGTITKTLPVTGVDTPTIALIVVGVMSVLSAAVLRFL